MSGGPLPSLPAGGLVLASASPRRRALLELLGLEVEVRPAGVDETPREGEGPEEYVERLARAKATAVAAERPAALVLGADTEVALDGVVLGKPPDAEAAVEMLLRLSGRTHRVLTALALATPDSRLYTRLDEARVTFRRFGRSEALAYVATGEPMDKAGAYGIQGRGAVLVKAIRGNYHTVVGLSPAGLVELLAEAGWLYDFSALVPRARTGRAPAREA